MRIERSYDLTVEEADLSGAKLRVDAFLAQRITELSRSALTGDECSILINGKKAKKSDKVAPGDRVELSYVADVFEKVEPEDIELDVLYEDSDMLVINKAQGMVVHPGAGNTHGTIVNALAYRYGQDFIDQMADECDISRPGIVHRLDKDTSGVMVIALNPRAHAALSEQFQNREIEKYYYAFCDGIFQNHEDDIECMIARDRNDRKLFAPVREQREYIIQGGLSAKRTAEIENEVYNDPKYRIGGSLDRVQGKYSKSHYEVVRQLPQAALVKVRIFTGRTHQIRVHMKYIGHPVIGDVMYNSRLSRFPGEPLMLHSAILEIAHPTTGEMMRFEAPLPERFKVLEEKLRNS
ncbi:MAG: RluA family pseudouridine synthase [Spirochaetales bacterium]|nr:RluA family pseudouridine synthase [Spirochaetales bacterium]MBR6234839.1 RluA family pseudouridine synthase [Spirochaetales bacterium]